MPPPNNLIKETMQQPKAKTDPKDRITPQERFFNKVQHMHDSSSIEPSPSIKFRGYTVIGGKKYKVFN